MRLGVAHYELALAAVREIARAADPDEYAAIAVAEVGRVAPSDFVALNEVDPQAGRVHYVVEPPDFEVPSHGSAFLGGHPEEHPIIHHMTTTGDGSARRISDEWTQERYHASRLYVELYSLMGVE